MVKTLFEEFVLLESLLSMEEKDHLKNESMQGKPKLAKMVLILEEDLRSLQILLPMQFSKKC